MMLKNKPLSEESSLHQNKFRLNKIIGLKEIVF